MQCREYLSPGLNDRGELDLSPAQAAVWNSSNSSVFTTLALNPDACKDALQEIWHWKMLLFVVLYYSSGAPLRLTEWSELLIFSTSQVARSVYVSNNLENHPVVALETCYSLRSHREFFVKRTVRYLDNTVGQILVNYVRLVHPWYLLLRAVAAGEPPDTLLADEGTEYTDYPAGFARGNDAAEAAGLPRQKGNQQ